VVGTEAATQFANMRGMGRSTWVVVGPRGLGAVIWIMAGTICACARTNPVTRGPTAALPSNKELGRFVTRAAPAEKKAKLQEAARELDALYAARFAQAGATSAVVGIVMDGELVSARSGHRHLFGDGGHR
jgi:hypothetical protein